MVEREGGIKIRNLGFSTPVISTHTCAVTLVPAKISNSAEQNSRDNLTIGAAEITVDNGVQQQETMEQQETGAADNHNDVRVGDRQGTQASDTR